MASSRWAAWHRRAMALLEKWRIKPKRGAHKRLVASIRAHGLLEPLIVRATGHHIYHAVAEGRRLAGIENLVV